MEHVLRIKKGSMTIEEYNSKNGMLKSGYTTGTCATAAAKAAVFLLAGNSPKYCKAMQVQLPIGITLQIPIEEVFTSEHSITVLVRKYSGDDPDITNGILIGAKAEFVDKEKGDNCDESVAERQCVEICGGEGVGRITKAGLLLPVGEAAINPTPRETIQREVFEVLKTHGIKRNVRITILAKGGEEIAKKTFNPKLGIIGGISILGTTGLVTPMSSDALIETIALEMKFQMQRTHRIVAAPGAYGSRFLKTELGIDSNDLVEFSNYLGEMLDIAVQLSVEELLICGHLGKMVKLAGGIMNTHSNEADARLELISAHVIQCIKKSWENDSEKDEKTVPKEMECMDMKSAYFDIAARILDCTTTTEAVEILKKENILPIVMHSLAISMLKYARQRMEKASVFQKKSQIPKLEIMVYTLEEGLLARVGDET